MDRYETQDKRRARTGGKNILKLLKIILKINKYNNINNIINLIVNINNIKLLSLFQVLQSYAFYLHPLIHVLDFFAVLSLDSVFYFYFIR